MLNSNIFPGKIPRTTVLGEKKICFCSPKMYHNCPTAMQNSKFFGGQLYPGPSFQGGEFVFILQKCTVTLLQQCKIQKFSEDNTPDLRFRGGGVCFHSPKMYWNSPTAMQNSETFPGKILQIPVLGERKVCFRSPKMYQNSPTARLDSNIFPGKIPRTPVLGRGKYVFVLRKCTITLLYSNAEFKNFPGSISRTLVLGGICFHFPKMFWNSPTAIQNSKIFPGTVPGLPGLPGLPGSIRRLHCHGWPSAGEKSLKLINTPSHSPNDGQASPCLNSHSIHIPILIACSILCLALPHHCPIHAPNPQISHLSFRSWQVWVHAFP